MTVFSGKRVRQNAGAINRAKRLETTYKTDSHKWTVKEVIAEAKEAVWDFRRLVLLAERIALKDSGLLIARKR